MYLPLCPIPSIFSIQTTSISCWPRVIPLCVLLRLMWIFSNWILTLIRVREVIISASFVMPCLISVQNGCSVSVSDCESESIIQNPVPQETCPGSFSLPHPVLCVVFELIVRVGSGFLRCWTWRWWFTMSMFFLLSFLIPWARSSFS